MSTTARLPLMILVNNHDAAPFRATLNLTRRQRAKVDRPLAMVSRSAKCAHFEQLRCFLF